MPLEISDRMLKVQSTWLPCPRIQYHKIQDNVSGGKAKWNLAEKRFSSTTRRALFYAVLVEDTVKPKHVEDIRTNFERQLDSLAIGNPTLAKVDSIYLDHKNHRYEQVLR